MPHRPCRSNSVQSAPRDRSRHLTKRLAWVVAFWLCGQISVRAQVPNMNIGFDQFGQMDFAQMYLDQMNRKAEPR